MTPYKKQQLCQLDKNYHFRFLKHKLMKKCHFILKYFHSSRFNLTDFHNIMIYFQMRNYLILNLKISSLLPSCFFFDAWHIS